MSEEEKPTTLYVYGVRQKFDKRDTVTTLFFFDHDESYLVVLDVYEDKYYNTHVVKAFLDRFNPKHDVNHILLPYLKQLIDDTPYTDALTEDEITEVWNWLPASIMNYFNYSNGVDGATDPGQFVVECDPDEVPNSLDDSGFTGLAMCEIYPQELSSEFVADIIEEIYQQ